MTKKCNKRSYLSVLPPVGANRSLYLLPPKEFEIAVKNNCMVKNIDIHDVTTVSTSAVKTQACVPKKQIYTDSKRSKNNIRSSNLHAECLNTETRNDCCLYNALVFGEYLARRRCNWNYRLQTNSLKLYELAEEMEKLAEKLSTEEYLKKQREFHRLKRDLLKSRNDFHEFFGLYPDITYGSRITFLAYESYVPSEKFLPTEGRFNPLPKKKSKKYASSKKRAKKRSQDRRAERKFKQNQRDYYMFMFHDESAANFEDWTYFDKPEDFGDDEYYVDYAYNKFINSPATVEAAWAIYEGADSINEHFDDVAEAEMLYADYLDALRDATPF